MSQHDFFESGIFQGDYYNLDIYNPNHVFEDVNGGTSAVIEITNDLLADESLDSRSSHDGEAYLEGDILMCERRFKFPEYDDNVYGSRPVWQHATVSYYEDGKINSKIYNIATSVSVGGVHRQLLMNRYTLGLAGDDRGIVDASVEYPDIAYNGVRRRIMTPYDLGQVAGFLVSMKNSINQDKEVG
ncbi:hypothetical protein GX865_00635 [Candidatus Saccharibacteria bacterium]|jgi:hypothetical protein|nr:hypothetical protein [Candidatus Saccharibacteria bacterium]